MSTILQSTATAARGWQLAISTALLLGMTTACSNDSTSVDNTGAAIAATPTATPMTPSKGSSTAAMERVLVTLKPAPNDAIESTDGNTTIEAAAQYLTAKYPQSKVLRTMAGFSQLLIEIPNHQIEDLSADPIVLSAKPDASHRTMQNTP